MPLSCSVPLCKTGYGSSKIPANVSLHKFPLTNPTLLKQWLKNISRKNFTPTKYSCVCSLHFLPLDFIIHSSDKNKRRQKKRCSTLSRKILKSTAVPTQFQNFPSYYVPPVTTTRSTNASSSVRQQKIEEMYNKEVSEFFQNDLVHSLKDIEDNLPKEKISECFEVLMKKTFLAIYYLQFNDTLMPVLSASIIIDCKLKIQVFVDGKQISVERFNHIVEDGTIKKMSELVNVMALIKSWVENPKLIPSWIDLILDCMQKAIEYLTDDQLCRKLTFLFEQVQLLTKHPNGRRYSSSLLTFSYTLHSCSSGAYRTLRDQDVISLPSSRTLCNITRSVEMPQKNDDQYLHLRFKSLTEHERHVSLIIDEIYVAKRVELAGNIGHVTGLTTNHETASTVLCFMISSAIGKNRDVVAMYPTKRLTTEVLEKATKQVLCRLDTIGFNVIAIITDNLATNQKYMKSLCGNSELKAVVSNPANPPKKLHLLFDNTHNLKNIYNIWQRKKLFKYPNFQTKLEETADFRHLEELYALERNKPLRMAHKLNERVLFPSSMEKMSVKLALSVFCESTRDALNFYVSEQGKDWKGTADFISWILKYWNIANVKTTRAGIEKRDESKNPIRSIDDEQLHFLSDTADLLRYWRALPNAANFGLTRQTFTAVIQTSETLVLLSKHCLVDLGFHYVSLSKFLSDRLEGRFGRYRQMNGGNYFLSCRQLFENERKIRAVSLLKFSNCSFTAIKDMTTSSIDFTDESVCRLTSLVTRRIQTSSMLSSADANIIYYVTGALVRSTINRFGCDDCSMLLLDHSNQDEKLPVLEEENVICEDARRFIKEVNRGGLLKPSTSAFAISLKCWLVYLTIFSNDDLKSLFLASFSHKAFFVRIIVYSLQNEADNISIDFRKCEYDHDFVRDLIGRCFNCMTKNLVRDFTNSLQAEKSTQKLRKLTGKCSK